MRHALPAFLALAALLAHAPTVLSTETFAGTERDVTILVYHVYPDPAAGTPRADPFSTPLAPGDLSDGTRLPVTRVDGGRFASEAPEGDPASAAAHFREVRALVQERQRAGGSVPLELEAHWDAGRVWGRVTGNGTPRAFVVEDAIPFDADSGVTVHRFVARAELPVVDGVFNATLDPSWSTARIGVVAWLASPSGEVLQSASRMAGDASTVRQVERSVLVEHATATWCQPCGPSDQALALLASQYGFPPPSGGPAEIVPRLSVPALAGLAAGALAGILLLRRPIA